MSDFSTWLVIDHYDPDFRAMFTRYAQIPGGIDWSDRPRIRMERRGARAVLQISTENESRLFGRITRVGEKIIAASSAPLSDIDFFYNKIFQTRYGRFRVSPADPSRSDACWRRLIVFELYQIGAESDLRTYVGSGQGSDDDTDIESIEPAAGNLWLEPCHLELDEESVSDLFNGKQPLAASRDGVMLLPPVRTAEHASVQESYFSPELLELRAMLDRAFCESDAAVEPTCAAIIRVSDDPLLRDFLLDGGALQVTGGDGEPSRVQLHVSAEGKAAASFRARFILSPEAVVPPWAMELAHAVRDDVRYLLAEGLDVVPSQCNGEWELHEPGAFESPGPVHGTLDSFKRLRDEVLSESREVRVRFDEKVVFPAEPPSEFLSPDSTLAERRFMHYCWRRPWKGEDEIATLGDAWHMAMLEMIDPEYYGQHFAAEQRISKWNEEFRSVTKYFLGGRNKEDRFVVRHGGIGHPEEILKWRLLLPIGTIVAARTILLDHPVRSLLDSVFVLG